MWILRAFPRSAESEILGLDPAVCILVHFYWHWFVLSFENCHSSMSILPSLQMLHISSHQCLSQARKHDKYTLLHRLINKWLIPEGEQFWSYDSQVWSLKYNHQDGILDKNANLGAPGWLSGWASAFGSGHDPGIQAWVLHQAPCREPASPSAYVSASLSVSHE